MSVISQYKESRELFICRLRFIFLLTLSKRITVIKPTRNVSRIRYRDKYSPPSFRLLTLLDRQVSDRNDRPFAAFFSQLLSIVIQFFSLYVSLMDYYEEVTAINRLHNTTDPCK